MPAVLGSGAPLPAAVCTRAPPHQWPPPITHRCEIVMALDTPHFMIEVMKFVLDGASFGRRAANVPRPGIELMNIAAFCERGHLVVSMCSTCVTRGRRWTRRGPSLATSGNDRRRARPTSAAGRLSSRGWESSPGRHVIRIENAPCVMFTWIQ